MAEIYATEPAGRNPQQARTVDETTAKVIGGGSSVAALCGLGAVVLGILGLAGVLPQPLCSVAILAAGAGLIFEGGAIAARFRDVRDNVAAAAGRKGMAAEETGIASETVGGIAAVVLGILALIHVATLTLLPAAAIVLGATLLLGSGGTAETIEMPGPDQQDTHAVQTARRAGASAAGADALVGIGAVTLGILGLVQAGTHVGVVLSLVALLSVGVAELVSDSTLAARMMSITRHT